ncbi:MAG TPA: ABC transporter ATP-binding protein [Devosiaceae bacterium]|jgi:oligopeptide/dipeptide ABC transporter ATP-binding protein|nr:ABC transporter ATP-binding protein [Devosiaceae bacterium]
MMFESPSRSVSDEAALQVTDLTIRYATDGGDVHAVEALNLTLKRGEVLGLIGESGCGKSTAAYGMLRLLQAPGRVTRGAVRLEGEDLLSLSDRALRRRRWSKAALIPQGAMNSLNPTMTVGAMFNATMKAHGYPAGGRARRLGELLEKVGLPLRAAELYPHELSGGMKQRVCIALAITLDPVLVIADEPTSALDVVVQRTVVQTLVAVQRERGLSMILIGHDLGLLAQAADRIAVMYAGRLVECAPLAEILNAPRHPYTQMLLDSVPTIGRQADPDRAPGGIAHDPRNPPPGCIFQLRCPMAQQLCRDRAPAWTGNLAHGVACHFAPESTVTS